MKNKKTLILAIAIIAILLSFARVFKYSGFSTDGNYRNDVLVLHVIDGDTIKLSNGKIVRYIGIDTPELREKSGSGWTYKARPYAEDALDFNKRLVEGKVVRLEFDAQRYDKYNRLLAYAYIGDKMVNLEMVRQGYAMIYTYPPNVKYIEEFIDAQQEARKNKRGLWFGLEDKAIAPSEARNNIGLIKAVEAEVINTYLSEKALILICRNNFKVVIFKNNFKLFPIDAIRSPNNHYKNKNIRVYGVIKEYKGSNEIIANDPSQIEVLI